MRQTSIDRLQNTVFRRLGDDVEVFAPGADVGADRPVWTGRSVRLVDQSVEAPGDGLSYEAKVQGFSFRASDAPSVPQGAIVRYAGVSYVVERDRFTGGVNDPSYREMSPHRPRAERSSSLTSSLTSGLPCGILPG